MKRKLLIIGAIVASIGLTACGSNEEVNTSNNEGQEENIDNESQETKGNIDQEERDNNENEDIETKKINDQNDEENDNNEEDLEESEGGDIIMSQDEMIETSDYIAKVKMIQKGQDTLELKILDNMKGRLSKEDIPSTDLLKKNRAYLVFLKSGDNGLELTNGDSSYILLEGDNHEIFEKINKSR